MRVGSSALLALLFSSSLPLLAQAGKLPHRPPPVAHLAQGTVTGYTNKTSGVDAFLGIPYAKPPVRFARAVPVPAGYGNVNATAFGPFCAQNPTKTNGPGTEDCLTVNVFRPAKVHKESKLPVAIYHYGGSFSAGYSSLYPGHVIVKTAAEAKKPFILVTMNYRLGMYGFASGALFNEEVKKGHATLNVGYWDQREAQLWVAKNIEAFGGDPNKVTIWGQSAGAFAIGAHLTLPANQDAAARPFRAAIFNSGSPQFPVTLPPTHPAPSSTYIKLLNYTGCPTGSSSSAALACLRKVDASTFAAANIKILTDPTPIVGLIYTPPALDGVFFPESPNELVRQGKFADVPILTGNMNDEGTLFASTGLGGNDQFNYALNSVFAANIADGNLTSEVLRKIGELYPDDLRKGSPYLNKPTRVSQGITNGSDPFFTNPPQNQYKRMSSVLGDIVFVAQRRFLLANLRAGGRSARAWAYKVAQIDKGRELAKGSAHGDDLPYLFGNTGALASPGLYAPLARTMQRAWASFVVDLDPTTADGLGWPAYAEDSQRLYHFKGQANRLIRDDFRVEPMAFLTSRDAAAVFSS